MLKQDLKDGMILETRNGERYLLTNGVMRDFEGYISLVDYSEDLRLIGLKSFDIVKVYEDTGILSLQTIFEDEHLTLLWERKELTDREIEVLKALRTLDYEWLARDSDNELYAYSHKPEKNAYGWNGGYKTYTTYITYTELFNFIKWEDEEPTKIDDLLKGV